MGGEPEKKISIKITDDRPTNHKIIVGDQPSADAVEIIGDRMDGLVKIEAIRIMQIRQQKMKKHKLRKWRIKFKHLIRKRIEAEEKAAQKELDDSVAAIHGDAHSFNPVDKVRRNVELAKQMGYNVDYYRQLPLTQWLKKKEEEDQAEKVRFVEKNRYKKY